ncbi:putative nuclease HARBI1 [Coccinella septempunctata]|uniref:putative nuclease HARBI1 n=1 Tax=Coccinella septempunctata TaxID=41139 RepID=UPI001D07EB1E|nr:putative nuclease HARBI1 [Coccinella septempunctata]
MEFIVNDIIWEYLDELEIVEFGIPRRIYDRTDHFHNLDDFTFFKKFRLSKESVMQFLPYVENQLEFETDMNMSVPPINQLLTCLRLYATGAHLDCIADFIGIHPTTAGRIVQKVTRSIAILYDQFITFPDNERRNILKRQFYDIARFPHVVGAIDCTHVKIQSPGGDDAEIFRNRKGYFSINVQAICNADLKFQNVVGRWPGSAHDSTIFNSSRVAMLFENGHFDDCIILGDSGYPINKYLLTPLLNPTSRAEHLYNEAHIRTRNTIERCFGIWKRRFPILAYMAVGLKWKQLWQLL